MALEVYHRGKKPKKPKKTKRSNPKAKHEKGVKRVGHHRTHTSNEKG